MSQEAANLEDLTDIPALREMIDDIRESTGTTALCSNNSISADELLIQQAILSPSPEESTSTTVPFRGPIDTKSETLLDALTSTSKRLTMAINSATIGTNTDPPEPVSTTVPVDRVQLQMAGDGIPKKKHIMISYNRSCEEGCRRIRNKLKEEKYKVWMDVFDMPTNFIDGMAKAIRNSYIVLLCINRQYYESFWCKKEAEDVAIQRIKYIPCFMETPFLLEDWLSFLVGANVWVDFSPEKNFDDSFEDLIRKINLIETELALSPRETPPTTPSTNPTTVLPVNPTIDQSFDVITRNFKTWVEENREHLRRMNPNQSSQLINELIQNLQTHNSKFDDPIKSELLQQLLSPPSASSSSSSSLSTSHLLRHLNPPDFPMLKSIFFLMALWAVRVIFQKRTV